MHKVLDVSSEILDRRSRVDSGVLECRGLLDEYVRARVGDVGRKRAVAELSGKLGWSPRRILGVLHGEVRRMWFDEVEAARGWHRSWCEQEGRRLEARAALMRARREAREHTYEGVVAGDCLPGGGTDVAGVDGGRGDGGAAGHMVACAIRADAPAAAVADRGRA